MILITTELLEQIPGKTLEESREIKNTSDFNEVRTKIGAIVKKEFPENNPASTMIKSGGAGNTYADYTNGFDALVSRLYGDRRINIGYNGRTLSFFKKR